MSKKTKKKIILLFGPTASGKSRLGVDVAKALNGEIEAASNMISMTSGAALYVAGIANDIKEGVEFSQKNLKNGKAAQKLEELKLFTNNLQQNEK